MNGLHILFHYVEACQCKLRFHPKSIGLSHATQFSIIHENKNLLKDFEFAALSIWHLRKDDRILQ